jgi:hypothetical protein
MRRDGLVFRAVSLVTAGFLLASCASSTPQALATPSQGAASQGATPVLSLSATATPLAVVAATFVSRMTSAKSARIRVSGTIDAGSLHGTITGHREFEGTSLAVGNETRIGTLKVTTEQVQIGLERWGKQGSGPWLKEPAGTVSVGGGVGTTSGPAADVIRSVQPKGTVDFNGEELVRLLPTVSPKLTPDDVGLLGTAGSEARLVEFLAKPDGTPRVIRLTLTLKQTLSGRPVTVKNAIDLVIESIDEPVIIAKPDDVWVVYRSKRYGFSLAHPEGWEYNSDKNGEGFESPTGPAIFVSSGQTRGLSLSGWTSDAISYWLKQWKKRPEKNEPTSVAGRRARLLTYHVVHYGYPKHFLDATVINGTRGYDFQWYNNPGSEAADRQLFLRIVATITIP